MIFREILLLILLVMIWLYGIYSHNMLNQSTKDQIKLPKVINGLFGGFRKDGLLNFKALFAQLTFLLLTVLISLVNFSLLSRQQAFHFLTWSLCILAIFIVVISLYKDRKP